MASKQYLHWVEDVSSDARHSIRLLGKHRLFAIAVIATMALGIGANTTIFSLVNAVLLNPLPYPGPTNLLWVTEQFPRLKAPFDGVITQDYLELRDKVSSLEYVAAYNEQDLNLVGLTLSERVRAAAVSSEFFSVLQVQPSLGRVFTAGEQTSGNDTSVILSDSLWRTRFGRDDKILGNSIKLNNRKYIVVGVMPASFDFPQRTQLWIPLALNERAEQVGSRMTLVFVVSRLKPRPALDPIQTQHAAQAEVNVIAGQIAAKYDAMPQMHGMFSNTQVRLVPLHEHLVQNERSSLLMLMGAVGLILIIACVNIANLLTGYTRSRSKEIAIRVALGASRMRLLQQLLTESLLLSLTGGVLGVLVAVAGVDLLVRYAPPDSLRVKVILDLQVLAFAFITSLLSGLIFGILPAWESMRIEPQRELCSPGTISASRALARKSLSILELALALVLLAMAGLLLQKFNTLRAIRPGFIASDLMTFQVALPDSTYPDDQSRIRFFEAVLPRLSNLPGARSAAVTNALPLTGVGPRASLTVDGHLSPAEGKRPTVFRAAVSLNYFETMGIPLVHGRTFVRGDQTGDPVAIINQNLAQAFFGGEDPIGKRIKIGSLTNPWSIVVGVVGDTKQVDLETPAPPVVYQYYLQGSDMGLTAMTFAVRTAIPPETFEKPVRNAVLAVDQGQPIFDVMTMEQRLSELRADSRTNTILILSFAIAALILAAVGIYGVISYQVRQRTREIGIRRALGAKTADIFGMVLREGLKLILIGLILGVMATFIASRLLKTQIPAMVAGRNQAESLILGIVALLLGATALAATVVPAYRATKVSPLMAIRSE